MCKLQKNVFKFISHSKESVKDLSGAKPSVFRFSQSFPGRVHASWRVMKLGDNLFLSFSKVPSFNKEWYVEEKYEIIIIGCFLFV